MTPDEERGSLTPEQADYYRQMLVTHADTAETDACHVCRVSRCPDWRYAYDTLAVAGEPMVKPRPWYPPACGARGDEHRLPWSSRPRPDRSGAGHGERAHHVLAHRQLRSLW